MGTCAGRFGRLAAPTPTPTPIIMPPPIMLIMPPSPPVPAWGTVDEVTTALTAAGIITLTSAGGGSA